MNPASLDMKKILAPEIPCTCYSFGFLLGGNGQFQINQTEAVFHNLAVYLEFPVGCQIIISFYRYFFFQIVFLFFEKIINILADRRRYFVAEKVNRLSSAFRQMKQGPVVGGLYPQQPGFCQFGQSFLQLEVTRVSFVKNKFGYL